MPKVGTLHTQDGGQQSTLCLCSPRREYTVIPDSAKGQADGVWLAFTEMFGTEMENIWRLNKYLKAHKAKIFSSSQYELL